MNNIRSIIAILIFFCHITFFYSIQNQPVPLIVKSQTSVFTQIAKDVKRNLPSNIEILIYNINLLNGPDDIKFKINNSLQDILYKYQNKYKYSVLFEDDIKKKNSNVKNYDLSFIEKQDEQELIDLGKMLDQDAIMLFSVTLIEGKKKFIGDKTSNLFVPKSIALIQGICFNTDTGSSIYEFSYFFYLE